VKVEILRIRRNQGAGGISSVFNYFEVDDELFAGGP